MMKWPSRRPLNILQSTASGNQSTGKPWLEARVLTRSTREIREKLRLSSSWTLDFMRDSGESKYIH